MPLNQTLRKHSNILWTISIIQDQNPDAQTKSEFSEMANEVINTGAINHVTLCLSTELQRFRLMIEGGISEDEALKQCKELERTWSQDNQETIQKLKDTKNLSFLTWKEFLIWPDYANTLYEVERWYKENRDFRLAVDGRVRQAQEKIKVDAKIPDLIEQTKLLKLYLFEECAYQKFASNCKFHYELYKTPQSKAIRRIKSNTDFVPHGFMAEVNFTQFNPAEKKQSPSIPNVTSNEQSSFASIFTKQRHRTDPITPEPSLPVKTSEFIEKTLAMLSPSQQEKAAKALMKFISQEIIPLCYETKITLNNN